MRDMLKKYSGVLFFYLTIIAMIWLVNTRFNYLNNINETITYALND